MRRGAISPFLAGFLCIFTLGSLVLAAAWLWLGASGSRPVSQPPPAAAGQPTAPAARYHEEHEGHDDHGNRTRTTTDIRPIEEDPTLGSEWKRLQGTVLPCGHRWAYFYFDAGDGLRRDVCEQGHCFRFEEGIWVPKPPTDGGALRNGSPPPYNR